MPVDDLRDIAKLGSYTHILDNCKCLHQALVANVLTNQPNFQFPAKTLVRLRVAAQVAEYYLGTSRMLPAAGVLWTNHLCNLQAEMESLDETKKKNINLELSVISNTLKTIDWLEAYDTFCDDYVDQSVALLNLVSRSIDSGPVIAPA